MKQSHIIAVLALTLGLHLSAGPGAARPSFSCSGNLNLTERTICNDVLLGDLDQRMARIFYSQRDTASRDSARRLVSDQRIWLSWRNTCADDGSCLRRRYEQRIIDLAGAGSLPPGFGNSNSGLSADTGSAPQVIRRVRNGRYELVHPDGQIDWRAVDGGAYGTEYPDGTGSMAQFSQAPAPSFPALPAGYSDWGAMLEDDLLRVVDSLLPPPDRPAYRVLHENKAYSDRILRHVRAIDFLLNE